MRRSAIARPTGPKLEAVLNRQREKRAESVKRWQEKRRANHTDVGIMSGPLKRRKRIRPVNPERRERLFRQQFHSEDFVKWVHSLGCSVPGCRETDIEAAHAKSTGAAGTWQDVLPLCVKHHRMQHDMGIRSFEQRVGFRLSDVAASVCQSWRAFVRGAP